MAKNTLISGTLWEQYSKKVADRMDNPLHRGEITAGMPKQMGARSLLLIGAESAEMPSDGLRRSDTYIIKKPLQDFGSAQQCLSDSGRFCMADC
jgi:hypothetical protein